MADYDFDFGQILHHPTDAQWDEQFEYGVLWTCLDAYGNEWMSRKDGNKGNPLPKIVNGVPRLTEWWRCRVNVQTAYEKGEKAKEQGNTAAAQGNLAKTQGDYANNVANGFYIGDDNYIYMWDEAQKKSVRTNKKILNFDDLTDAQKRDLVNQLALNMASAETCAKVVQEIS